LNREQNLARLEQTATWDIVIIGGGATGLGTALDAAARGYRTVLLEQSDFAKATSSRSTKLVHGGVRYLQQGNISLVREALRERNLLAKNAPHLVSPLDFIVPSYRWYDSAFYGIGLKAYDALAGKQRLGKSRHLSRGETIGRLPTIRQEGLRGGSLYVDAGFDDARLAISIAQTAHARGALLLNYMRVVELKKDPGGTICGVVAEDLERGRQHHVLAKVVVNATGPFTDAVRKLDDPHHPALIAPSQGAHIVLDASFLPGDAALLIPRTDDGRILFLIPWHGVTVVGTTDTPISTVTLEPRPLAEEIEFILASANQYLAKRVTAQDIRSTFVGIRPLVKEFGCTNTSKLSRDHTIVVDPRSKLLTVAGGKWTTYRNMAEDVVDQAAELAALPQVACPTSGIELHGATDDTGKLGALAVYGTDARKIQALMKSDPNFARRVHPDLVLSVAEVVWACRAEMARTLDDVLARRSRWLILDARMALTAAESVARVMQVELGRDETWVKAQVEEFERIAQSYLV
jgi:glycerol-3-phosphate dehydrogenase